MKPGYGSTDRLIHDSNDDLKHHTGATILLLVCYAWSHKLHGHVPEMFEVTVSIHSGNHGMAFQKLQDTGLVLESGSLQCHRGTRFLDGHPSARLFFNSLEHIALFQCSKVQLREQANLTAHTGSLSKMAKRELVRQRINSHTRAQRSSLIMNAVGEGDEGSEDLYRRVWSPFMVRGICPESATLHPRPYPRRCVWRSFMARAKHLHHLRPTLLQLPERPTFSTPTNPNPSLTTPTS